MSHTRIVPSTTFFKTPRGPEIKENQPVETILKATYKVLQNLQEQAAKMQNKMDEGQPVSYGTSAEEQKQYKLSHSVAVSIEDTGLTKECFYAVSDIIKDAITKLSNSIQTLPINLFYQDLYKKHRFTAREKDANLHLTVSPGSGRLRITADHPHFINQLSYEIRNLPAPIGKVPFDKIKEIIGTIMTVSFDFWQHAPASPNRLNREFKDGMSMYRFLSDLRVVEKACQNLDSSLEFETSTHALQVSVNQSQLEKAKILLGYSSQQLENNFSSAKVENRIK